MSKCLGPSSGAEVSVGHFGTSASVSQPALLGGEHRLVINVTVLAQCSLDHDRQTQWPQHMQSGVSGNCDRSYRRTLYAHGLA